ncbi:MAG: hypothetical protein LBI04_11800 [Treponema sp.]|nr:hypothetical protein [Treponema sp.]
MITSLLPIIVAIIVVFIVVGIIKGRRGNSASLILEEFNFNEKGEEFLFIKGRVSGFWNWVLSLFDKAPTICYTCNKQELKIESKTKSNIPLINITCVTSGMLKSSVLLLVISIICIIVGLPTAPVTFGGVLFLGIILLIVYTMNKKSMLFDIYISENLPMIKIRMKRGIINSLDIDKFEQAANMLKKTVLENNLK